MAGRSLFLLTLLLLAPLASGYAEGDQFVEELDYLRRKNPGKVGRDALVEAYEDLIDRYPGDARVAEAMLEIACLYENTMPDLGIYPDADRALLWSRRAADTAAPGSDTWFRAQFLLCHRVRYLDASEARQILENVSARATGDPLISARVEKEFQSICVIEHDLDAAEGHCRRLLGWYADPARIPKDVTAKAELDGVIRSAATFMVEALGSAPWPVAVRMARIRRLMDDYVWNRALQRAGERKLEHLRERLQGEIVALAEPDLEELVQLPDIGEVAAQAPAAASADSEPTPADASEAAPPADAQEGPVRVPWVALGTGAVIVVVTLAVLCRRRRRAA